MTQFNPPRKQASLTLATACLNMAADTIYNVGLGPDVPSPLTPEIISHPKRKFSFSTNIKPKSFLLLGRVLDALGIEGRKRLAKYRTSTTGYNPFEIVENTAAHWSMIVDVPQNPDDDDDAQTVRSLVLHCTTPPRDALGKRTAGAGLAYDVAHSRDRFPKIKARDTQSMKLTVEQLRLGYSAYLTWANFYMMHSVDLATVGPRHSKFELSWVLGGLGSASLSSLIDAYNSVDRARRTEGVLLETGLYEFTMSPDVLKNIWGRDDDHRWTLVKYNPYGVDYAIEYDPMGPLWSPKETIRRRCENSKRYHDAYERLLVAAIEVESE